MKTSRKSTLLLAGALLLSAPMLRADDSVTPPADKPGRHERGDNLAQMAKDLNLTADQQAKIGSIHQQAAEARRAIRADTSLSEEQKREKLKELRRGTMDQVRALLTPEQQAKAKELREARRAHWNPPPAEKPPGQ
jgi:Spy/CpxP family protein refolding chaperone